MAITGVNTSQSYDYTGGIQTFTAPFKGVYKLEVWGAQGGMCGRSSDACGGYGGYSVGYLELNTNQKLYIAVGGAGSKGKSQSTVNGGYNGGGTGWYGNYGGGGGGGCTHISTTNRGVLKNYNSYKSEVLIVAGGGGGGNEYPGIISKGGAGGGTSGSGTDRATGGSQSSAGTNGGFGYGGGGSGSKDGTGEQSAGGGGGWYGGGCGHDHTGGGGGSGYIDGVSDITVKGTSYVKSTSNGKRGVSNGALNGYATITCISFGLMAYIGDKLLDAIYIGDNLLTEIK